MVTVWGGFIPPQVRRIAVKLNNRRTILVGLAFLSICTFWQMYDSVMTLILTDTFKLNETFAGAIMAADNVLALFLLPFFGALSDKTHTKIGRRMPFIVGGTTAAAVLMNLIPLLDDRYAANPSPATLVIFIVVLGLLLIYTFYNQLSWDPSFYKALKNIVYKLFYTTSGVILSLIHISEPTRRS